MVGEVLSGVADMAIADLTITSTREKVMDFTLPYMNTGVAVRDGGLPGSELRALHSGQAQPLRVGRRQPLQAGREDRGELLHATQQHVVHYRLTHAAGLRDSPQVLSNTNGNQHFLLFHFDYDFFLHCKLGRFSDHRESRIPNRVSEGFGETDQDQVRLSCRRID
ncbi:hypothetical protein CDAR_197481 [Caerostris darwini]|uniref:Ionotropic glutamate receptor L-glutamate and glycine-binding domain-containing protein n=1 Tax=Caerostris darwini TaxID=1538125 RepID=A0AAV4WAX3_9ARAC|nr:hypothetical protein CDAR_197481 [Caerostris darwini]